MNKPLHQYNISQIGEMLGFGRNTVRKRLKQANVIPSGREGNADLYLLSEAGPAVFESAGTAGSSGSLVDPNLLKPGDRLSWYRSETERLKFELETGQLCLAEEVRNEMANLAKPMLAELEILPDILERDCGLSPDVVVMIQEKVDDLRNSIAEKVSQL
ncbi:DUF1441 family protein [Psychromonas sp. PT13]|uniref:DUF1441 family protein n=1 Tax=Psychromonas sp. PT13 TaxID=3439547 RepID=UPI003EB95D32